MKNVSEMRTKTTSWCAWPHVVQKPPGEHNARPHRVSEMRVSVRHCWVSLEENTRKKLSRQHFGCCDGIFLAHASTYSSWRTQKPATDGMCLQEILQKKTRESRKSAKIKSTQTQMKNRQEKHGRHSERIRKA